MLLNLNKSKGRDQNLTKELRNDSHDNQMYQGGDHLNTDINDRSDDEELQGL